MVDTRPLHIRVKALAQRFDAMAIGAQKQSDTYSQVADNHRRDAATLHEALKVLEVRHER